MKSESRLSWDAQRYATTCCLGGCFRSLPNSLPHRHWFEFAGSLSNPYSIISLLDAKCMCWPSDPTFNFCIHFFYAFICCFPALTVFACLSLPSEMLLRFSFCVVGDYIGGIHGRSPWMSCVCYDLTSLTICLLSNIVILIYFLK